MDWQDTLQSAVASAKASVAVLLVLAYGFFLRSRDAVSRESESGIGKLCTTVFLPALLFSEIGPNMDNLKECWPILPASLFFQLVAMAVAFVSTRFGMPRHFIPIFVFNNVTSLPLLLLEALSSTGALDPLILDDVNHETAIARARVLILINALVGNLTRFAFGPWLMRSGDDEDSTAMHAQTWTEQDVAEAEGAIRLPDGAKPELSVTFRRKARKVFRVVEGALNPPLVGGLLAVAFGIVPFFQRQLFNDGFLSPIAQSLSFVGKLYTALQMLVLGAQLKSKKGSRASAPIMIWLFIYRFALAPLISISAVYFVRTRFPDLMVRDPFLDLVLCISNVGPPALTLAAVARMAGVDERREGLVARILMVSYMVTPLIALSVTAAIGAVTKAYSQ